MLITTSIVTTQNHPFRPCHQSLSTQSSGHRTSELSLSNMLLTASTTHK
jgi:hypothetical protein